jgi:splicing factor 3B subunit 4
VNLYGILQLFFSPASSGVAGRGLSDGTYEYSRRVFGSVLSDVSRRADRQPVPYPSY